MDGTTTLRMNEFMLATIALGKADLGAPRSNTTGTDLPQPTELKFTVNSEVQGLVQGAEKRFDELIGQHDLRVSYFRLFMCTRLRLHRFSTTKATARISSRSSKHRPTRGPSSSSNSLSTS